jgi:5-methylthioadenosine/S-adenosylhomocysteine deaminase
MGMDEAGINDDRDMLREMRMVLNTHRTPGTDGSVPTAPQVLRMVTSFGAATTAFRGQIGSLKEGVAADLFMVVIERRGLLKMLLSYVEKFYE